MPWSQDRIPKYRKHRASGQAVVTLRGRDYYLGPHGTKASQIEYDRLLAEYLATGRSASFGREQRALTVVEIAADYLQYAKSYYGPRDRSSEFEKMLLVVRPLRRLYGRLRADEFGPVQFKAVRQQLIDRELSRSYINEFMRRVAAIFKWAAAEGKIPPAVAQTLSLIPGLRRGKSLARETDPVQPVDDAVVEATLPHLPEVVADMVRFQRLTGARPAETCLLRPCDVDRRREIWTFRPRRHKTEHHGRDRVILIGPRAQEIVLKYLERDAGEYCFRPCDSEKARRAARHAVRKTPLSQGNRPGSNRAAAPRKRAGSYYTTASYRRSIHRACDKAFPHPTLGGTPVHRLTEEKRKELQIWQSGRRWSPNQLRHAAATAVRREFGLEAAQVILGHSQADVTQVYAERDLAKGFEVARRIG